MFSFVIFENDRKNNKIDCQYISSPIIGAKNFLLPDDEYLNERDFLRMLEKISNSKGAYVKNFNLNSKYQNLNI